MVVEVQYRKWVVLVAVYCAIITVSATSYMSGILYAAMLERYHCHKAWASLVVSVNSGLLCLLGPVVTVVTNRWSCRVSMVLGGTLMALAGLLSGLVDSVDALIVTYGIIGGIGNALAVVPGSLVLSYYFTDHRNIILALYMTSVGLGVFCATPLAMWFLKTFALSGAFFMIGAVNFQVCIFGMLCKPSKLENELRHNRRKPRLNVVKEMKKEENVILYSENCICTLKNKILRRFSVRMVRFSLFLISTFTWNAVLAIFLVHLPSFATQQGSTAAQITMMMALLSVCNTVGRLVGAISLGSDRTNPLVFHISCLCLAGIIAASFPAYETAESTKYILAGSIGLLTGPPNSMMTPITLALVGVQSISSAHGWELFFCGAGFMVGPPLAAAIYDYTKSYRPGFIFAGVLSLVGSGLALVVERLPATKPQVSTLKEMNVLAVGESNASDALLKTGESASNGNIRNS